jgi:ABC-type lipoprotein release transport system permease subunit
MMKVELKLVGTFDLKVASLNKSWAISTIDNVGEKFDLETLNWKAQTKSFYQD